MPRKLKCDPSKELLIDLYEVKLMTAEEIAEFLEISKPSVLRRLHKFGIFLRKSAWEKQLVITKKFLDEHYIKQKLTTRQIGKLLGCSAFPVEQALKEYGIQARTRQDYHIGVNPFLNKETGKNWNYNPIPVYCSVCKEFIEYRRPSYANKHTNKFCKKVTCQKEKGKFNWNYNSIVLQCSWCGKDLKERSPSEIDNHHFCSRDCLGSWMSEHLRGENSYQWKGGWEEYYGPSWHRQREKARQRDNGICQFCYQTKEGDNHPVHHLIPFRSFGVKRHNQANHINNLNSLCTKDHSFVETRVTDLIYTDEFCQSFIHTCPKIGDKAVISYGVCYNPFKKY